MHLRGVAPAVPITLSLCFVLVACKKSDRPEMGRIAPPQSTRLAPQPLSTVNRFEWLDSTKDAATWTKISQAFRQELLPDQPSADPHVNDYAYKQIAGMGRYGDAVIGVLEKRAFEDDESTCLFELYNFNLAQNSKSRIATKGNLWFWEFRQLARFDDGPTPDITFQTESCTECEPAIILGALRFDPQKRKWEIRRWPKGEEGVAVADSAVNVDESVEEYETVSGIGDFQGKGHDQVGIWTHFRHVHKKDAKKVLPAVTTLSVYGFQDGNPVETDVKDPSEIARFKKLLCQLNPKEAACKKPAK